MATKTEPTCVDCLRPESGCECKGITSTPVKEIWLSEHLTSKDVQQLIADFIKTGRNPSSNLDQFVAFVFEAGDQNGYTRRLEGN